MTNLEKAFEVFSTFPEGLADFEFSSLLDGMDCKQHSSALLSLFVKEGVAEKRGRKTNPVTGNAVTVYAPNGRRFSERVREAREPTRKRRGPYDSEVRTLRAWKAAAIARYPDLAVDPVTFKARAHVAEIFRGDGNEVKAVMAERGELDSGDMMRAVVALMSRGKGAPL